MEGVTTSTVIRFAAELEEKAAGFYEEIAKRDPDMKEIFLAFAKENRKNSMLVVRTYQETITDAIEACFSFQGLQLVNYLINTDLEGDRTLANTLHRAILLEKKSVEFYKEVTERSGSLLATIPETFSRMAKERDKRKIKLEMLLKDLK